MTKFVVGSNEMSSDAVLLVLGVGGNVSQGILKALAASSLKYRVVGACVDAHSMGLYACDHAVISPFATDPQFVPWVVETSLKHEITGILSGVEPVLSVLATHQAEIEARTGARIIVSPPEKLAVCGDKLLTAQWLKAHGLNYPRSADTRDAGAIRALFNECGYNLFAKPRNGKGSHGIKRITSECDLAEMVERPNYVIQEYLGDSDHEFTAAAFCDRNAVVRGCIVFQRQLLDGTTVRAEAVDAPEVRAEVLEIARRMRPMGPCNMQLRLHQGRAVCFEINLRYSGTTPIRAQLGFNDTEAGVRHFILGERIADLPTITAGVALRFWNEIIVDPRMIEACRENRELPNPSHAVTKFESLGRFQ
jgi:carbamoyl-phosphate synthase large subunit